MQVNSHELVINKKKLISAFFREVFKDKKSVILTLLIFVLIAGNILLGIEYLLSRIELNEIKQISKVQQTNAKILFFAKLFVDKVLLGSNVVGFEDRLQLENAVRDINDAEIFAQWQKFTNASTDEGAQREVGILFNMLLDRIYK